MSKDAYGNPNTPVTATAIDVDYGGAVTDRVVGVYPTTTARDAALTSPDTGQAVVITGDDEVQVYDGSAWVVIANLSHDVADSDFDNGTGQLTSTSYDDLASVTSYDFVDEIEVTITTGERTLILFAGILSNNTAGSTTYLAYRISGASTSAAATARSAQYESSNANDRARLSGFGFHSGLTPGSQTVTLQAKVSSGIGTITSVYLLVIPLP